MANPLMTNNQTNNPIEALNTFVNNGGNPQQMLQMMLQKNPNVNKMMNQLNNMRGNQSLEQFALQAAKERGLDIEQIKNLAQRMNAK
jgi:hemoglobin-like flavoprotein